MSQENEQSPRDKAADLLGVEIHTPADEKRYPVPGQGIEKRVAPVEYRLPVIQTQHLTTAPALKTWIDTREGKPLQPHHQEVIDGLKRVRKNGAPVNLNVNSDGYYDLAFSGSNGNMVRIEDFYQMLLAGMSFGDCLQTTKLVCGANGSCGNPGPCAVCRDIRDNCYVAGVEFQPVKKPQPNVLPITDAIDEEINALVVSGKDYRLHGLRIVNMENSSSADVSEVRRICQASGRGVVYALEMLGVYRQREAASHDALKRQDLGGH